MLRSVVLLFLFVLCLLMAPSHSTYAQDSLGIGTVDPIKDSFVDDDGLPIDLDPTVDTILDKERKIIEAAGHVWNDAQKKWVPA